MLLHLKEDIDLPTGNEASSGYIDAAVKSAESFIQAIEVLYITGDSELRESWSIFPQCSTFRYVGYKGKSADT
jgi:hypothetical protein